MTLGLKRELKRTGYRKSRTERHKDFMRNERERRKQIKFRNKKRKIPSFGGGGGG